MKYVEQQAEPSDHEESVGILNVHARMALKYGPPYGVCVHSVSGQGSKVTLRFPKDKHMIRNSDKTSSLCEK